MSSTRLPISGLIALNAGKAVRWVSRATGRGGTALPGRTANALHRGLVGEMSRGIEKGSAVVTGTNGKTTTTRMIAAALRASGLETVTNREGANLMQGIATALLTQSDARGRFDHSKDLIGLFEVDEAVLPVAIEEMSPTMIIVTNLFRDQLDRYFEIDFVAALWTAAMSKLPSASTLVLNADDPLVAYLGAEVPNPVVYYGLQDQRPAGTQLERSADSRRCPRCSADLEYTHAFYAHLGHYSCPSCGWKRPTPSIYASNVELQGAAGSKADLVTTNGTWPLRIPLPGAFNVYNAVAAAAAAISLGAPPSAVTDAISHATVAFGRMESLHLEGRTVSLEMAKNPSGFNQVFDLILRDEGRLRLLLAINNNPQDSRDISWIWDIDVEALKGRLDSVTVSGMRADEMVLRLKYGALLAEVDGNQAPKLSVTADLIKAFDGSVSATPPGATLHVVANYSAMWAIRNELVRRGLVAPFWEV